MEKKDGVSLAEAARMCREAGYGEQLPASYDNSTPVVIQGYLMPNWMAEVLGHIGRKPIQGEEKRDDKADTS